MESVKVIGVNTLSCIGVSCDMFGCENGVKCRTSVVFAPFLSQENDK
jgi:hypothetical protein